MLKDLGVSLVMLGHSERRHVFGETDEEIHKKVLSAARHKIRPLLCIGETQKEKDAGISDERLRIQLKCDLFQFPLDALNQLMIAYEPVWAIGTGKTATNEIAQDVCAYIRSVIADLYDQEVADAIRIQYGGSVKPEGLKTLLEQPDIDGALVGGASLQPDSYIAMIENLG